MHSASLNRPRAPRSAEAGLADLPARNCLCRRLAPSQETPVRFHDEAAYAHLLEVICGLGSPIVGETEVMSQFKAFAAG